MSVNDERAEKFIRKCESEAGVQLSADLVEELSGMLTRAASDPAPVGWRAVPVEPTPEMMRHFAGMPVSTLEMGKAAKEYIAYAAMLAAAPTLTDADYERMARAHYEVERETRTDAPPFTRWSTWEEACELPGWKDRKIAAQRAALAALGAGG